MHVLKLQRSILQVIHFLPDECQLFSVQILMYVCMFTTLREYRGGTDGPKELMLVVLLWFTGISVDIEKLVTFSLLGEVWFACKFPLSIMIKMWLYGKWSNLEILLFWNSIFPPKKFPLSTRNLHSHRIKCNFHLLQK